MRPIKMESVIPSGIPPTYTLVVLTAGFTKFEFSIPGIPIIICGGLGNPAPCGSNPYAPPPIPCGGNPRPGAGRPGYPCGGGRIIIIGLLNPMGVAGLCPTGEGSFGIGTMPFALGEKPWGCGYDEGGKGGIPGRRVGIGMPGGGRNGWPGAGGM